MRLARFFFSATVALGLPAALVGACGGDDDGGGAMAASDGAALDRARLDGPYRPDASCEVIIESPDLVPSAHLPEGTNITWSSNPPSSGSHYPIWANFGEYTAPVPRAYLVHSMEHGATLLLYKCEQPCPAIVDELRKIRDALQPDPMCAPETRVRVILAPDPLLDMPVAAAAWGWTYKAQCVDAPTLGAFVRDHYAQGPENTCAPGKSF